MQTENDEIEILDVNIAESFATLADSLPTNFLRIGELELDDVQIYIKQEIYNQIEVFSSSDVAKELGGILVGDYIYELERNYVLITGYIHARYTDASASTLTFTHDTWEYIYNEHKKLYPDKKIVGWHHTHPSYGIFLSNYDLFIHENFFNFQWQVAYVVDPIAMTRGFFQWKNNKVLKANGFHVFDEVGEKIQLKTSMPPIGKSKDISITNIFLFVTSVILLVLTILFVIESLRWETKFNEVVAEYKEMQIINNNLQSKSNQIKNEDLENGSTTTLLDDMVIFKKYTVSKGDYLEKICIKSDLDYIKNIDLIKKINDISDENSIYSDQIILLPISK